MSTSKTDPDISLDDDGTLNTLTIEELIGEWNSLLHLRNAAIQCGDFDTASKATWKMEQVALECESRKDQG